MTDEEYVRAHFPGSHELEGRHGTSLVWLDKDAVFGDWAAAAEFTRERLEQIRKVREEIEVVESQVNMAANWIAACQEENVAGEECAKAHIAKWQRIRTRLESALADLKQGMRTAGPDGARSDAND